MWSPMAKIYERRSGWVSELWAVSEDHEGNRVEALLEIDDPHPRWLDAWLRAGEALCRVPERPGEVRR